MDKNDNPKSVMNVMINNINVVTYEFDVAMIKMQVFKIFRENISLTMSTSQYLTRQQVPLLIGGYIRHHELNRCVNIPQEIAHLIRLSYDNTTTLFYLSKQIFNTYYTNYNDSAPSLSLTSFKRKSINFGCALSNGRNSNLSHLFQHYLDANYPLFILLNSSRKSFNPKIISNFIVYYELYCLDSKLLIKGTKKINTNDQHHHIKYPHIEGIILSKRKLQKYFKQRDMLQFSVYIEVLCVRGCATMSHHWLEDEKRLSYFQEISMEYYGEYEIDLAQLRICKQYHEIFAENSIHTESFGVSNNWCVLLNDYVLYLGLLRLPANVAGIHVQYDIDWEYEENKEFNDIGNYFFQYKKKREKCVIFEDVDLYRDKDRGSINVKITVLGVYDLHKRHIRKELWNEYGILNSNSESL